jgi:sulfonate transport system substrate-binding protein
LSRRTPACAVKELEGKTVGVALGSYAHRYLLGVLDAAGLTGRTRVVYLLGADFPASLQHASIGAYAAAADFGPVLAAQGYPVIDQGTQHPELLGSYVIVASADVLKRAPQLPAAWNRARRAAIADIKQDSNAYFAFHEKQTAFSADAIKTAHPVSQFPVETLPAGGIQLLGEAKRFLLERRLIRDDFTLQHWQV